MKDVKTGGILKAGSVKQAGQFRGIYAGAQYFALLSPDMHERGRAQGIPYLRFYYNHEGWWNTRSYVTRRIANALTS